MRQQVSPIEQKGSCQVLVLYLKKFVKKNIQQVLSHVIYSERNQLKPKSNRMEDN